VFFLFSKAHRSREPAGVNGRKKIPKWISICRSFLKHKFKNTEKKMASKSEQGQTVYRG